MKLCLEILFLVNVFGLLVMKLFFILNYEIDIVEDVVVLSIEIFVVLVY